MAGLLEGKVSLVTGAASGIGRAASLVMSREGAAVVVSDVNADGAEETLSAIKEAGGDGMFVHADVSRPEDVAALIGQVVSVYGRVDCAYNNAGIEGYMEGRLHEYPEDQWDRLIDINLKGVVAVHEARDTADDRAGRRGHRQHRLGGGSGGVATAVGLRCQQARGGRADEGGGAGICARRDTGQRRLPRNHRHADDTAADWRTGS